MNYLLVFLVFFSFYGISQEEPISGMYWNNYSYFNPAMSGVKYKHEANASYRKQWNNVFGPPNTLFVNYGLNLADKLGLGFNYVYESIGFSKINRAKINYNYQLNFKETRKLSLGVAASYQHLDWDGLFVFPSTPEAFYGNPQNAVNVDLGIAYFGKKIMAGLSTTQLPLFRSSEAYNLAIHLFGNVRYEHQLERDLGPLIFETKLRTDFIKYSQDFNVGYRYNNIVEVGIGYRTNDAIIFNATGILKEKYRVGYAYEMTINTLSTVSKGTHEIMLSLRIPK